MDLVEPGAPEQFEYTQASCDVWQVHHLCNHFAEWGWEPVLVFESHPDAKLPEKVGNQSGPLMVGRPLRPYEVLFRRPLRSDDDEAA